ncbi:hypothetical protein Sjap_020560 [Stephania japonica]|uniref:Uncharacterized protein n=1 Tax=Stephania japonica TaxID=461633 RepID=A0AAP0I0D9_9MAGN
MSDGEGRRREGDAIREESDESREEGRGDARRARGGERREARRGEARMRRSGGLECKTIISTPTDHITVWSPPGHTVSATWTQTHTDSSGEVTRTITEIKTLRPVEAQPIRPRSTPGDSATKTKAKHGHELSFDESGESLRVTSNTTPAPSRIVVVKSSHPPPGR